MRVVESLETENQKLKRESNWIVENLLTDVQRERLLEYQLSSDTCPCVNETLPDDRYTPNPIDDDEASILRSIARSYQAHAAAIPRSESDSDGDINCSDVDEEA